MTIISSPNAAAMPSGLLGLLTSDSQGVQNHVTQLSQQASTGLVAQTYGGMGAAAQISLDLRPQLSAIGAYTQNISQANTQLTATSQVLTQLQQIASTFSSGLLSIGSGTSQEVDTLASQASAALTQVQSLLNTQLGDKYIFAGQDSSNAPLPNSQFNAYVQSIQSTVSGLTAGNGSTIIASTLSAAMTNSPFSSTLGTAPEQVTVGPGVTTPVGIVAGQDAYVTQSGASTTGSYVRDLIRSLATIAGMNSSQTSLSPGFSAVVNDTLSNLQSEVTTINNENGGVGAAQQNLTADQTSLTDMQTALTTQVSNVENVDAASTATALSQAQTQLQISYKLIASAESMSLVSYLPTP
ncbi:MAG: flagellin [Acetobacteraceae bacterium]|nr:flagellin [Acetobacteraceae bacterium]